MKSNFMKLLLQLCIFLLSSASTHAAASIIPSHASGLVLAKVTSITQEDHRSGDGDLVETVKLNIEKSTGCTFDSFAIPVAFGGLRPPGSSAPTWNGPPPGSFKEGEKYWIAISSRPEYGICRPEIIGWWSGADKKIEGEFEKAIQQNLLQKRPHYSPTVGVTIHHYISTPGNISVEALKEDRLLWKKEFSGTPSNFIPLMIGPATWIGEGFRTEGAAAAGIDEKANVVTLSVMENLNAENPYGVPTGNYAIRRVYDLASGKLIADFIHDKYMGVHNVVSSKRIITENYQWNPNFPTLNAFGQKGNLEKIVRKFDSKTGNLLTETRFYYDKVAISRSATQSPWVQQSNSSK